MGFFGISLMHPDQFEVWRKRFLPGTKKNSLGGTLGYNYLYKASAEYDNEYDNYLLFNENGTVQWAIFSAPSDELEIAQFMNKEIKTCSRGKFKRRGTQIAFRTKQPRSGNIVDHWGMVVTYDILGVESYSRSTGIRRFRIYHRCYDPVGEPAKMSDSREVRESIDPYYTAGQFSTAIINILFIIGLFFAINWISSFTGLSYIFLGLSILAWFHSILIGFNVKVMPFRARANDDKYENSLTVNILFHIINFLIDGTYYIMSFSFLLKNLTITFTSLPSVYSNYKSCIFLVIRLFADQVSVGALNAFQPGFLDAIQGKILILLYISGLIFTVFFWRSFVKSTQILKNPHAKKTLAAPERDRLNHQFAQFISSSVTALLVLECILAYLLIRFVYSTGNIRLGFIVSAIALGIILLLSLKITTTSKDKMLSSSYLSGRSDREKYFVIYMKVWILLLSYGVFAPIFFSFESSLYGGFSGINALNTLSNYASWLFFTVLSLIDQISFNLISILKLNPVAIQATHTSSQIIVYISGLITTILFWNSMARFFWPNVSMTQKQLDLEKEIQDEWFDYHHKG